MIELDNGSSSLGEKTAVTTTPFLMKIVVILSTDDMATRGVTSVLSLDLLDDSFDFTDRDGFPLCGLRTLAVPNHSTIGGGIGR